MTALLLPFLNSELPEPLSKFIIAWYITLFFYRFWFFTNPEFAFGMVPLFCILSSISMMVLRSIAGGLAGLNEK